MATYGGVNWDRVDEQNAANAAARGQQTVTPGPNRYPAQWQYDTPNGAGRGIPYPQVTEGDMVTASGTPGYMIQPGQPDSGLSTRNNDNPLNRTIRKLSGETQMSEIMPGHMNETDWLYYNFPRYQEQDLALQAQHWGTTGTGPSAAQALLNQQRGANVAQARSMAASQAGVNPAIAYRGMSDQAMRANVSADQQAAALRAQEQQAMLAQAANLWAQNRGADQQQFNTGMQGQSARLAAETQTYRDEAERDANSLFGSQGLGYVMPF